MSFTEARFLVFALVTFLVYFIFPRRWQWFVTLVASVFFYLTYGPQYIGYISVVTVLVYLTARLLEKRSKELKKQLAAIDDRAVKKAAREKAKKARLRLCALTAVITLGIWVVLKYGNFFIENVNAVLHAFGNSTVISQLTLVMPIGISFYTFHAVGYLVDVYRGKYAAEKNLLKFAAFMFYFPHIVQGPFSRFDLLGKTLFEKHAFSYDRMCEGLRRMLWGYFKKIIVADIIGIPVAAIFGNANDYGGVYIIAVAFFYGIQIYADFSGYMDIICGFSHILGIEVAENFRQPYFAHSVEEFWRRWHITLGQWFRDYLFYPISMGKLAQKMGRASRKRWGARAGKLVPSYFSLIFVWMVTGLWHGAAWNFVLWGFMNLFVIVVSMQLQEFYEKVKKKLGIKNGFLWNLFSILRTFLLVCGFRFFSRASSMSEGVEMMRSIVTRMDWSVLKAPQNLMVGLTTNQIWAFFIGFGMITIVDILSECGVWEKVKDRCPIIGRNIFYLILLYMILLLGGGANDLTGGFLYAQF